MRDQTTYECQSEFIDGAWYGDGCDDCTMEVRAEMVDCLNCEEDDYCPKHENGIFG